MVESLCTQFLIARYSIFDIDSVPGVEGGEAHKSIRKPTRGRRRMGKQCSYIKQYSAATLSPPRPP